ncbi:hypothetical protein NBRC116584_32480 [Hydrogenophaga sp. 5NK40-0174]
MTIGGVLATHAWSQDGQTVTTGDSPMVMWVVGAVVLAVLAVLGFVLRSKSERPPEGSGHSQFDPVTPRSYSPQNVGNDASARPWEQVPVSSASEKSSGLATAVAQANRDVNGAESVPEGFDRQAFLNDCQQSFRSLQSAWDNGEVDDLRARLVPSMLDQLEQQLTQRAQEGAKVSKTEIYNVQAQLIQLRDRGELWCATVEFSGMSKDEAAAGPGPFRELWEMQRQKGSESPWLVADVQAIR